MKRIQLILTAAIATALAGCAPLKVRDTSADMPRTEEAARLAASAGWNGPAVVREGRPMMVLMSPTKPPAALLQRQLKIELEPGSTVQDIVMVLANLGYSIVIADRAAAEAEVLVPRYHGTLGGLLSSLERVADVWTVWENDALVVTSRERVAFTLPQERKLANRIASGLNSLGVCVAAPGGNDGMSAVSIDDGMGSSGVSRSSASASTGSGGANCSSSSANGEASSGGSATWEAGFISLSIRPSEYREVLRFLERITRNAAVVNLQVAMVSVSTNQDVSRGIDWSKLQLAVGSDHNNLLNTLSNGGSGGDDVGAGAGGDPSLGVGGGTGGVGGIGGSGGGQAALPDLGEGALISGATLRGVLSNGAFSMIGFLDYLETYGETRTLQSVLLKTVTGSEVELKSVTEIPYVSDVGVGTLGNQNNNTNGMMGSAGTQKANDGVTLKMLPSFDAASHTVTIDMSLAIEAVVGFNELSAGNQLGTLSQPTTAKRTFNDVIRVRPGQTVVVGGISYDQLQRNNNVPLYLSESLSHRGLTVKRESMFIVLRPTVMVLGALRDESELNTEGAE